MINFNQLIRKFLQLIKNLKIREKETILFTFIQSIFLFIFIKTYLLAYINVCSQIKYLSQEV